jgi:serine protease AprX
MTDTLDRAAIAGHARRLLALAVALLLMVTAVPVAAVATADRSAADEAVRVVVRGVPGALSAVVDAVERVGGSVLRPLPIIDGVSAGVPAAALPALDASPHVHAVTVDHGLRPQQASGDLGGSEVGAASNVARMIGADEMWRRGWTGAGVDVAVIDTGVSPVEGLTVAGKVVNGPDLSFDGQVDELRHLDAYGHGTAMAGIIAGRDAAVADPSSTGSAAYQGIAPGARIVNVKVGASNGTVDVSQVIAAIDWVVQHRRSGDLDIRVLNLSYGTDSVQSPAVDPLAYAAEVAWRHGIVVVAASGNDGRGTQLATPAAAPSILAVGAADPAGTVDTADDRLATFSTYANGQRRPDLLAPGVGIVGLRTPGSYLDERYPQAIRGDRYMRGSGTSQAAAITSGAVALLLQQRPSLTPDQVKALLRLSATPLKGLSNNAQGAGQVNLRSARTAPTPSVPTPAMTATGQGSLDASRGTRTITADGVELRGEQDIFGNPWNGASWSSASWSGASWSGGTWNGASWSGASWSGASWSGASWSGASWSGASWSGASWSGASWSGASWSGASWSGASWSGASWSGASWSGASWSGTWSSDSWA